MPFDGYVKRGLLKKQSPNFKQIEKQVLRSRKDLETAQLVLYRDDAWAATIAYHAMLRAGRAFIWVHGFLPADGAQHRTVVEVTGKLLGEEYTLLMEKFEMMRRRRNIFFYESEPFGTQSDAETALKAASQLIQVITKKVHRINPQLQFDF